VDLQLMTPRPYTSSFPARPISPPILVAPPKPEKVAPPAPEKRKQPRYRANLSRKAKRQRDRKKVPYVPQSCRHQVTILQTKEQSKGKTAFERLMADQEKGRTAKNWQKKKGHNPCKQHSFKARKRRIDKKTKAPKKPLERTEKRSAYLEYLSSPLWRDRIRPRVMERDGHRCRTCSGKKRLQVHHRSYDNAVMKGRDDTQLITLCRACHLNIEFVTYDENDTSKQVKRSRVEVEARLNDLLGQAARIRNVPAAE
jgi:hypothetical protein